MFAVKLDEKALANVAHRFYKDSTSRLRLVGPLICMQWYHVLEGVVSTLNDISNPVRIDTWYKGRVKFGAYILSIRITKGDFNIWHDIKIGHDREGSIWFAVVPRGMSGGSNPSVSFSAHASAERIRNKVRGMITSRFEKYG